MMKEIIFGQVGKRQKENGIYVTKHSIEQIIKNNFEPGPRQAFEDSDNENPLNNEAKQYAKIIEYKEYKLRVVFMCRINPEQVKICNDNKYYIVSGGNVDDEVRPYRVLFHFE